MSEANVKRFFASKRFTLARLEQMCRVAQLDIADLVAIYDAARQRISQLSVEQEEVVRDLKLLLVAVSIKNRLTFHGVTAHYRISKTDCISCLATLDKLKLIDLLPDNRIKPRIADDFRWLPDGPIERLFQQRVQKQFLDTSFTGMGERRLFLSGMVSEASRQRVLSKIQALVSEFAERQREDARVPLGHRQNVGVMLALRGWELELLAPLRRGATQ